MYYKHKVAISFLLQNEVYKTLHDTIPVFTNWPDLKRLRKQSEHALYDETFILNGWSINESARYMIKILY